MTSSKKIKVRAATLGDTRQMAEIAGGDTTAQALADWMDDVSAYAAWHVAEADDGTLLGFQRVGAGDDLTSDTCQIATFLRPGAALAVGSRLFEATAKAARLLGYAWIEAEVSGTNESAHVYYQSRGFRDAGSRPETILMRYEID